MLEIYSINRKKLNEFLEFEYFKDTEKSDAIFIDVGKELYSPISKKVLYKEDLVLEDEDIFKKKSNTFYSINDLISYFQEYEILTYISLLEEPKMHSNNLDFSIERIKRLTDLVNILNKG